MKYLMLSTFLALGAAYYGLSGGPNFVPEARLKSPVPEAQKLDMTATSLDTTPERIIPEVVTRTTSLESPTPQTLAPPETGAEVIRASLDGAGSLAPEVATTQEAPLSPPRPQTLSEPSLVEVAGSHVNMRSGPGMRYGVIDTLPRGTAAEVLERLNGWARLRIRDTGQIGWMAQNLLQDI